MDGPADPSISTEYRPHQALQSAVQLEHILSGWLLVPVVLVVLVVLVMMVVLVGLVLFLALETVEHNRLVVQSCENTIIIVETVETTQGSALYRLLVLTREGRVEVVVVVRGQTRDCELGR